MNIPELTPLLIVKLVAKGLVRDAAELYRLRIAEIAAVDGMTKESAKQLFDSLTASQSREAWRLLYGLSIPKLRPEDAQALCSRFSSVDNVFGASADRLMQAGVSQETAHSIVHWNTDGVNRRMVKRLFKARLNFKA